MTQLEEKDSCIVERDALLIEKEARIKELVFGNVKVYHLGGK